MTSTVIRAVPRIGSAWTRTSGQLSALLLETLDEPSSGPLWIGRPALRAWGRVDTAVRAAQARSPYPPGPCPGLCLVPVRPDDVATLGAAAVVLGRGLLPGGEPRAAAVLGRAASGCGTGPADLVRDLARVHGVLDLDLAADGELLYVLAGVGTGGGRAADAGERATERVLTMWRAGEDRLPVDPAAA
ncbi:hypothetical protein WIS52_28165 [Pseudonocardia nematodicida]|uniref:Uncharacterized protein n=1 Tax=Pseudonocardia nematodicida TaxID=1206997 RepID=A0ABV1KK81_9PSEU